MIRRYFFLLLLCTGSVALALTVGAALPGDKVIAFTSNPIYTRDVYAFDIARGIAVYLEIDGHRDEIPIWSAAERGIVYRPRPADPFYVAPPCATGSPAC